jgi:hypothetical protein
MYDFKMEKVERERLACRLFLIKKCKSKDLLIFCLENEEQLSDLDKVFNTLPNTS